MAESTTDFLTFIPTASGSKAAAQEAIRVHILRNRHRQRRRETQRTRGRGNEDFQSTAAAAAGFAHYGGQFQIWQPDVLVSSSRQSVPPVVDSSGRESGSQSFNLFGPVGVDLSLQDEGIECISPSNVGPSSEGSGSDTLLEKESAAPLDRQAIEEMLIQYYLLSGGTPLACDFLHAFQQSPATFSAFLAMVATRLSDEQGRHPLLDPAELENQALQEVSRQISDYSSASSMTTKTVLPACSTILTVALLAHLREGRHFVCHWKGLLEMIRLHGGLHGLRSHGGVVMYAFLLWAEGVALDRCCPESIGHLALLETSHPGTATKDGQNSSMQDLRAFLDKIHTRVSEHDHGGGGIPARKLTSPIVVALQQPPAQKARYIYDKWRRARLACLVYFAALSLDGGCHSLCRLQDHPHYRRIETEVLDRERRYTVYAEELYYITVLVGANREEDDDTNDEGNEDNPLNQNLNLNTDTYQLSCTVARLVNDTKVLDQRDRNTCYRLLALYLGFRDPPQHDDIVVVDMVAAEWVELSERLRLDSVSNSIGRSVSGA